MMKQTLATAMKFWERSADKFLQLKAFLVPNVVGKLTSNWKFDFKNNVLLEFCFSNSNVMYWRDDRGYFIVYK